MRHALAQSLPFYLVRNDVLPFRGKSFDSTYIQYVLHHVSTLTEIVRLLAETLRVSDRVIIVEEIKGDKTDVARAETFDKEMNAKLHPEMAMPVYHYYSSRDIEHFVMQVDGKLLVRRVIAHGTEGNGFLETHLFVVSPGYCSNPLDGGCSTMLAIDPSI